VTWEYKIITFGPPPGGKSGEIAMMTEMLNELGAEGWEAFAYNMYAGTFIMKRPKGLG
jgi:hypothetical protein